MTTTNGLFATLDRYNELVASDQTITYNFEDTTLDTRESASSFLKTTDAQG